MAQLQFCNTKCLQGSLKKIAFIYRAKQFHCTVLSAITEELIDLSESIRNNYLLLFIFSRLDSNFAT